MLNQQQEEKLEFLKRKEVRTMKKDVSLLREEEAKRERERIIRLEMEKKKKAEEEKQKIDLIPKKKPLPFRFWPKAQPPTRFQKIIVRIFIVVFLILALAFVFTFWYWYLREKEKHPSSKPLPPVSEKTIPPIEEKPFEEKESAPGRPEITIPPPLIPVETNIIFAVSEIKGVSSPLSQIIKKEEKEGNIQRIIIQDIKENKILGIKEFFEAFEIKVPEKFLDSLENSFTLFVYSQKQGNRLGFVAETKNPEELSDLLKLWEPTMEDDYKNLFAVLGKEGPALVPYFKQANYQGQSFRYQTFSQDDLGICYAIDNNYFIFTSSGESIIKIISQLQGNQKPGL